MLIMNMYMNDEKCKTNVTQSDFFRITGKEKEKRTCFNP